MKLRVIVLMFRCNDVVVGGTIQADNWDTTVDDKQTQAMLERAAEFEPTIKAGPVLLEVILKFIVMNVACVVLVECCSN